MNKRIAKKWTKALRSGKYKQGIGMLRNDNNEYCCLGVLCELAVKEKIVEKYLPNNGTLPKEIIRWAEIKSSEGQFFNSKNQIKSLIMYNDDEEFTFKEIAGIIDRNVDRL